MAINKTVFRGKEVITIDGKVDAFYINPIKPEHIKTYSGKNGPWTPTHRYNLVVDGQPISLGMGDKDGVSERQNIQGKDNDGKYHTLTKGLEVSVEVTENGEYQGKAQYQSSNSKVVVIDASGAEAPYQKPAGGNSGSGYTAKPKDMSGIQVGHSFNGAMNFITTYGGDVSNENIIAVAKKVHNVTEKVKAEYAAANPDMSAYDSGAAAGNSVLNACKLVGAEGDFEDGVYTLAMDFLGNVVPEIMKHVKGEAKEAPPAKITRAAPAKKPVTKAPAVAKKEPVMPPLGDSGDFSDMDDQDIPFANPLKRSGVHLVM